MVVSCEVSSSTKGSPSYTDIHCFSISGCWLVKTSPNCLCEPCQALKSGHLGSSALACSPWTIEWIYRRPWLLTPTTTPRPAAWSSPGTSSTNTPPQQREGHLARTLCCTTDLTVRPSGVIPFCVVTIINHPISLFIFFYFYLFIFG